MAKDQNPAKELRGFCQGVYRASTWRGRYLLRHAQESGFHPVLQAEQNLAKNLKALPNGTVSTTHELVKQLSQAKDFQEMVRIQTEFMQSLASAFGKQTKSSPKATVKRQQML